MRLIAQREIRSRLAPRHYYDLAKMAQSPVKAQALADPELLASVVEFKQRFYPRGWATIWLNRAP